LNNICILALNAFAEEVEIDLPAFVKSSLSALLYLSERIDVSLLTITSKTFNWVRSPFEVPEQQVHCEVDCIAEQ